MQDTGELDDFDALVWTSQICHRRRPYGAPPHGEVAPRPIADHHLHGGGKALSVRPYVSSTGSRVLFIGHEATRTGAPLMLLHLLRWLRDNTDIDFDLLIRSDGP